MSKLLLFITFLVGLTTAIPSKQPPGKENIPILRCTLWCTEHGLGLLDCAIPALSQRGPCYECGPFKSNPAEELCGRQCVDTSTDPANCGECGNQCPANTPCCNGSCQPNTGLQWAYYPNSDMQPNPVDSNYSAFDPTAIKTETPVYQAVTTETGLVADGTSPISIYGSNMTFPATYFVLNHRGYIHAVAGGTYAFTSVNVDDIILVWIGEDAYAGWTRDNADLVQVHSTNGGTRLVTRDLEEGEYYALRIVYANAQEAVLEDFSITAPNGTVVLGPGTGASPYIVQYSCDGVAAPPYPPFGQET